MILHMRSPQPETLPMSHSAGPALFRRNACRQLEKKNNYYIIIMLFAYKIHTYR